MEQVNKVEPQLVEDELKTEGPLLIQEARIIVVNNPVAQKKYSDVLGVWKEKRKKAVAFIEEYIEPTIKKLFAAHKEAVANRSKILAPYDDAVRIVGNALSTYATKVKQEQDRQERLAEEERKRKEEAERKRLEEQAAKAQASGKTEKAQALQEQADEVYVPPKEPAVPFQKTIKTTSGNNVTSYIETVIEITDEAALLKAVASGLFPPTFIEFQSGKIKKWAQVSGIKRQDMHGLRIYQKQTVR